ncbi:MAG: polyprenyl synthetase family protein [Desulfuromonadales bacterium]|jgi:octaprenyl-diphosphate synthase|nr:polyprenyl synthetase family protein [Desulfuromonadales bacterium]MDH3808152.1 polyprenyl synthetase family protein [Desulfuromonadales bacterium]MDH3869453.1 polyprenyl synthetase family protein [Desulfuromonadales bacterium]MDH4024870.1 polyprenyl synthetase family protein [Desulfuromonadales bacterium]
MNFVLNLLNDEILRVEEQFRKDLESRVPLIRKVGEYVLASGGKRVRPMMLLLSAKLAGYQGESHVGLASVVEFIHTATLLHDDVVDSAVLRRGQDSANAVWGNEASVLVGDFLFAKSFSIMVREGNLEILKTLSDATTQMAEGEVLQLISTCDVELDEERYIEVVRNKTAVLLSAASRCGALLGACPPEQEEALSAYGMDLGIAFQFMDDALDYVADQDAFGKECGHDLLEGKVTLPLIHTLKRCNAEERKRIAGIIEQETLPEEDLKYIVGLIHSYDGIDYTRDRAKLLIESAKGHLALFADCPAKEAMIRLADYVVSRNL